MTRRRGALARVAAICRRLPEAEQRRAGKHAIFSVRGKTCAYYLDGHHGDGIVALNCKVEAGANEALVAANPATFYRAAYLHARGWVGLRLDKNAIDWDGVAALVEQSYRLIAPRSLVKSLAGGGASARR